METRYAVFSMRLPALSLEHLPRGRVALFDAVANAKVDQGYIHAKAGAAEMFLFVHEGRAWCAGAREGGSPSGLAVSTFVEHADAFDAATLCRADLALFFCAAVMFRKAPAAHLPAALVDGEALLKSVKALGKDAVLAVQRRDAWALAFCRGGEPVALYAAPEIGAPATGSVADRLMEIVLAAPSEVTIDLYDEIKLPPAPGAGQKIADLASVPKDVARPTLVVTMSDRVVFRHRVDKTETIIGRGLDVDLALDNLSVSRRHAVVTVQGEKLVFTDLESENGLVKNGQRMKRVELRPGESVSIGKYTLTVAMFASTAPETTPPRPRSLSADIETITVAPNRAFLEHKGKQHRIQSAVFTIGSAPEAHLRVRGLLVAAIQAVLQVDGDSYLIERSGGARAVRVNGQAIRKQKLVDGDQIVIAGEKMIFKRG